MTSLARAQFEAFRHRESVGAKVYWRQGYHRHIISTNLNIKIYWIGSFHRRSWHPLCPLYKVYEYNGRRNPDIGRTGHEGISNPAGTSVACCCLQRLPLLFEPAQPSIFLAFPAQPKF